MLAFFEAANDINLALIPSYVLLLIKIAFIIAALSICIGIMLSIFEQRRINYIFILELPPSKVTSGFRAVFTIGFFVLSVAALFGLFILASYDETL